MLVISHVLVAVAWCNAGLTHDDDAGRATVDAESASCADVFVDHKDHVVVGIGAGRDHVRRVFNRASRKHMNALPRADVDAAFAHNAFGLVDVEELLRLDTLVEVIDADLSERVVAGEVRQRRIRFVLGHR